MTGLNKTYLIFLLLSVALIGLVIFLKQDRRNSALNNPEEPKAEESPANIIKLGETNLTQMPSNVLLDVPFTSQAPLGNWDDVRLNNGCEEASVLMAIYWAKNLTLTPEKAQAEIINMSDFHLQKHGHFHDLSNTDTLGLIKEYFNYEKAFLIEDINVANIKEQLAQNKAVIVPIDGEKIGNPYYQLPGPTNHKIIIIGYDDNSQEFIAHDPGTSRGNSYRYSYKILEKSLEDYPTGLHEKFPQKMTSMVVIEKED